MAMAMNFMNGTGGRLMIVGMLVLAILVPLRMVRGLIAERGSYYREAQDSVCAGWSRAQALSDPVLVVPYTYERTEKEFNPELKQYETRTYPESGQLYVFAENTKLQTDFKSDRRKRGLFSVPIYSAAVTMTGTYDVPALAAKVPADRQYALKFLTPYLSVRLADPRGLHGDIVVKAGAQAFRPEPGAGLPHITGFHVPLADMKLTAGRLTYAMNFSLKGTRSFAFSPTARQADIAMNADWPHPSFTGSFLPTAHEIRADGFTASWSVGGLATNAGDKFLQCAGDDDCYALDNAGLAVGFVDVTDLYGSLTRAVKYGVLFVGLTFAAFFMLEILRDYRIHPVQYLMVGAALAVFYLLLVALAEHIGFAAAYVLAAGAVCVLLGVYIAAAARSRAAGQAFAGGIATLYGFLYVTLGSEDYALLLGALLLFATLAAAMLMTRRIDWYAVGRRSSRVTG